MATGFGSGYCRFAPGTLGSIVGIILYALFLRITESLLLPVFVTMLAFSFVATDTALARFNDSDPKQVVIDEILGMWVALSFLPFTLLNTVTAFLLFRFFDIVKPFPINRLERIPGPAGVILDDLFAGLLAGLFAIASLRFIPL